MVNLTKKEKYLAKKRVKYNDGTLTDVELWRIPEVDRMAYLSKELSKKYKTDVKFECPTCASVTLFSDSGYITDEDLLGNTKIAKKFKNK